jgi:glycosyltransferase involved in cell wall biosynthesis
MRIVIIDTTFSTPPTGGSHTFLVHLAGKLIQAGIHVSIVSQPGDEPAIATALAAAGAELHLNLWKRTDLPEEKAASLSEWINRTGPDVYVISNSTDVGWLALPLLDPGIATIAIAHNDVGAYYDPLSHYQPYIDSAIAVSEEIQRRFVADCSFPPERTRQIPYGVESLSREEVERVWSRNSESDAPLRIGYLGRLVETQKRVSDLVKLATELQHRGISYELHLAGDGPARASLTAQVQACGLKEQVFFRGWLSPDQVSSFLREMNVFILMSEYEGLPVALLEAMGQGLIPVVSKTASGNSQLIRHGQNGFLVTPGDISGFADVVSRLADSESLRFEVRQAAWETGKDFSTDRMTEQYLSCFAQLTSDQTLRTRRAGQPRTYPVMKSCRSRYPFWVRKIKSHLQALAGNGAVGPVAQRQVKVVWEK